MATISICGLIPTLLPRSWNLLTSILLKVLLQTATMKQCLHLQSHFLEDLSRLQDTSASGHRVLNDQTGFSLTNGTLHQTLGS